MILLSKNKISPLLMIQQQVPTTKQEQTEVKKPSCTTTTTITTTTTTTTTKKNTPNNTKTTKKNTTKKKKTVRFQLEVSVREYPIILGDNPSPMIGPPLSIDWHYVAKTMTISQFPNSNGEDVVIIKEEGKPRKRSGAERQHLLLNLGYTLKDIKKTMKSIKIDQRKRRQTKQQVIIQTLMNQHIDTINSIIRRNLNQPPRKEGKKKTRKSLKVVQQRK